jgi:ferredoxin/coenzyme F420-reducing hydrogenase delta subunit
MSTSTVPLDPPPRHAFARGAVRLERAFDRIFGAAANPLRQLGALATWCFWLALVSGIDIYIFFDTSADGAWRSIDALEKHPLHGVVRSLHRYASDAFLLLTLLHLAWEWVRGRYYGFRWYSWVSGVPLVLLAIACGIVGYWLLADTRAQFVATGLGEWFGALPGAGQHVIRNFVTAEAISDRLFSLLIFLHIGVGLFLLLGLWAHLARLVRPQTQPQARATWSLSIALLVLCLALPALSTAPADFARVPSAVPVDWAYYGVLPLAYAGSPQAAWFAVAAATAMLLVLPWTHRAPRPLPVRVDLPNCNGCARCFADCPYGAVVMVPRTDHKRHVQQAMVVADLCASCGICVGACPSSTPFRHAAELVTGIDLPQRPLDALRATLDRALADAQARGVDPIVVFGCEHGARVETVGTADDVIALALPCSAALPPAFVEYAQRRGARAVLIADCGTHGCVYRFGGAFTRQRLEGTREPHLRAHARGLQVRVLTAGAGEEPLLIEAVAQMRRVREAPDPSPFKGEAGRGMV